MANEAVIIELPDQNAKRYTVANNLSIEKGALLWLEDPSTLSGASTTGGAFGGVAASEKVANDGSTDLGVWKEGVFDLVASGAITIGRKVKISGVNLISPATEAEINSGYGFGVAEETAADGEVIRVRVRAA